MKVKFFNNKQKIWVGPLGIIAFVVFYMVPNHLNIFTPAFLPLLPFENKIPFMDWTIWIYISDYLFIGLAFFLFKESQNMNKIFYSQIMMLVFAMMIFLFFPTTYPRPEVEYFGLSGAMVKLLHSADTPGNACPSLHVSMTFLACFGFLKERKKLLPLFLIWAILISISTITIKQHYVWDVVAGFFMALIFYFIGQKFIISTSNKK